MAHIARFLITPARLAGLAAGAFEPASADDGGPAALVEAIENAPDPGNARAYHS